MCALMRLSRNVSIFYEIEKSGKPLGILNTLKNVQWVQFWVYIVTLLDSTNYDCMDTITFYNDVSEAIVGPIISYFTHIFG